ncbi:Hypothetical predicted protein [Pelobates cultripes]|uniref:HMG box domain-containing protein n=1 Tax=Pelobates cultripes TaxID=61616 RepID=A0AAD1T103_PELCU|nr:Hypothetical predicted protein [Pelobates cultripes]
MESERGFLPDDLKLQWAWPRKVSPAHSVFPALSVAPLSLRAHETKRQTPAGPHQIAHTVPPTHCVSDRRGSSISSTRRSDLKMLEHTGAHLEQLTQVDAPYVFNNIYCTNVERRQLDLEELAKVLPGGSRPQHDAQSLLLQVLSYIEFLQSRIQDVQKCLVPSETPRECCGTALQSRKRLLMNGCKETEQINSWDDAACGVKHAEDPKNYYEQETEETVRGGAKADLSQRLAQKASPAFTLDHSYQSQSENSSGSGTWKHTQQPQYEIKTEVEGGIRNIQFQNKRKECGEKRRQKEGIPNPSNWDNKAFPNTMRCPGKRNKRRPNSLSRLQRLRKKCVNGFIMFCQLNRKLYLSAHPGTASTEATKELAELWREMSALERRPYCIRAYQFSVLHDRLVKKGSSGILHGSL